MCNLFYVNHTSINRMFANAPKKKERGGRKGLRPLNTTASHHSPRSSLPQARPVTLTTAAPSMKLQVFCEKGHFTFMLLKSP